MTVERSPKELWQLLETTLELGDELDFVLIECASTGVRDALKQGLARYAAVSGRPFASPQPGDPLLSWLERERARSSRDAGRRDSRPVYFAPVPPGEAEGFILARLNENRDNLHRDMRGAMCLVGLDGFLDRFPARAPSIWSFRAKTFSFAGLPGMPGEGTPELGLERMGPSPAPPPGGPHSPRYDVYISAAYRDEPAAQELLRRLEGDGVRCSFVPESALDVRTGLKGIGRAANEARFVVPLLSPDYGDSNAWRALERSREMRVTPERLRARMLPVLVRHCLPPPFFAGFTPLDFRSREGMDREYPNLLSAVTGKAPARAVTRSFEPVSDPLDVAFLSMGAERARAVMRLLVRFGEQESQGTCFLIEEDLILTCHHCVFDVKGSPAGAIELLVGHVAEPGGGWLVADRVAGRVDSIVGEASHDWAVFRPERPITGVTPLRLVAPEHPVTPGDRVSLVHHPRGGPKKVSLWGRVTRADDDVIQYQRLSQPGSAGAAVFNERWEVVGLTSSWVVNDTSPRGGESVSQAIRIERVIDGLRSRGLIPYSSTGGCGRHPHRAHPPRDPPLRQRVVYNLAPAPATDLFHQIRGPPSRPPFLASNGARPALRARIDRPLPRAAPFSSPRKSRLSPAPSPRNQARSARSFAARRLLPCPLIMRVAFVILMAIHGAIHLLGFVKAFGFARVDALTQPIPRTAGVFWLSPRSCIWPAPASWRSPRASGGSLSPPRSCSPRSLS
ncbi:MAG: trypsin-like peptidase domain-containing protein [Polyangiaceae bacterium]